MQLVAAACAFIALKVHDSPRGADEVAAAMGKLLLKEEAERATALQAAKAAKVQKQLVAPRPLSEAAPEPDQARLHSPSSSLVFC